MALSVYEIKLSKSQGSAPFVGICASTFSSVAALSIDCAAAAHCRPFHFPPKFEFVFQRNGFAFGRIGPAGILGRFVDDSAKAKPEDVTFAAASAGEGHALQPAS